MQGCFKVATLGGETRVWAGGHPIRISGIKELALIARSIRRRARAPKGTQDDGQNY